MQFPFYSQDFYMRSSCYFSLSSFLISTMMTSSNKIPKTHDQVNFEILMACADRARRNVSSGSNIKIVKDHANDIETKIDMNEIWGELHDEFMAEALELDIDLI